MPYRVIHSRPQDAVHAHFLAAPAAILPDGDPLIRAHPAPDPRHLDECITVMRGERPVARAACHINPWLHVADLTTGLVGSYACAEDADAASTLWAAIDAWALERGLKRLIGPMDGSTWQGYRFRDAPLPPPFFMEPCQPSWYATQWTEAGFEPFMRYVSHIDPDPREDREALEEFEDALGRQGAVVRCMDAARMEEELARIGQFSIEAFADNPLYSPIEAEAFMAMYRPIMHMIDPALVLMVEDREGGLQAFVFNMPDLLAPPGERLIMKSMARAKQCPFKGMGAYLGLKVAQLGVQRGYRSVVHALMHEDNRSAQLSREVYRGEHFMRYTLYAKHILP